MWWEEACWWRAQSLSKKLVYNFLLGSLYRFRTAYSLFSTTFIIGFHEASSVRLFIIADTLLAMNVALIRLEALEIRVSLGSWSRRSDKTITWISPPFPQTKNHRVPTILRVNSPHEALQSNLRDVFQEKDGVNS